MDDLSSFDVLVGYIVQNGTQVTRTIIQAYKASSDLTFIHERKDSDVMQIRTEMQKKIVAI